MLPLLFYGIFPVKFIEVEGVDSKILFLIGLLFKKNPTEDSGLETPPLISYKEVVVFT